jgi:CRP-like cAMP-binding protein
MTSVEILYQALKQLTNLEAPDFTLGAPLWKEREYAKGELYNEYRQVCKYLGFILDGVFRTYYTDAKTGQERNVFFYSQYQLVVPFKSFVTQTPCDYRTQAMVPSKILYIHIDDLSNLYKQSHSWERLGRILAEHAFTIAINRTEDFLFLSPEERYLKLVAQHPTIFNTIPLYHLSSYLGIQGPSLSRIRKRLSKKTILT